MQHCSGANRHPVRKLTHQMSGRYVLCRIVFISIVWIPVALPLRPGPADCQPYYQRYRRDADLGSRVQYPSRRQPNPATSEPGQRGQQRNHPPLPGPSHCAPPHAARLCPYFTTSGSPAPVL